MNDLLQTVGPYYYRHIQELCDFPTLIAVGSDSPHDEFQLRLRAAGLVEKVGCDPEKLLQEVPKDMKTYGYPVHSIHYDWESRFLVYLVIACAIVILLVGLWLNAINGVKHEHTVVNNNSSLKNERNSV